MGNNYRGQGHVFAIVARPGDTGNHLLRVEEDHDELKRRFSSYNDAVEMGRGIIEETKRYGHKGIHMPRFPEGDFFLHYYPDMSCVGFETLPRNNLGAFELFFGTKGRHRPYNHWLYSLALGQCGVYPDSTIVRLENFFHEQQLYWERAKAVANGHVMDPEQVEQEILAIEKELERVPPPHRGLEFPFDEGGTHLIEEPYLLNETVRH